MGYDAVCTMNDTFKDSKYKNKALLSTSDSVYMMYPVFTGLGL